MNYALCIAYEGTRYSGWQRLPGHDTVQGRLENVLTRIFDEPVEILGSGRTDKGVHAYGQWASFKDEKVILPQELQGRLNEHLPSDIRVMKVLQVKDTFHPRYSAESKVYLYRIETAAILSPFDVRYSYHLGRMPDLKRMKEAAACLTGQMDFAALSQAKSKKKSTVRQVMEIHFNMNGTILEISVKADGFLYNMMRRIVTAILEIGMDNMTIFTLQQALKTGDRSLLSYQVPPQGLYLKQVNYKKEDMKQA